MVHLSKSELELRKAVLSNRLNESQEIRQNGYKTETAEVWMAIVEAYYKGETINIAKVSKRTGIDRVTVTRHVKTLMKNQPVPLVTRKRIGQDTVLKISKDSLEGDIVQNFFKSRINALIESAKILCLLLSFNVGIILNISDLIST